MVWDLKELRFLVKENFGERQLKLANIHINSVHWKIIIAIYHLHESKNAFNQLFNNSEDKVMDAIKACFTPDSNEGVELKEVELKAEANLIACAQNVHAIADILGYVIYHSLKMPDMAFISLKDIQKQLIESELKKEIIKLLGLKEFSYLEAFVNTTKHFCVIFSQHQWNDSELNTLEHGMKFSSFPYQPPKKQRKRMYPEKWHHQFLTELNCISDQYVKIGQCINEYLAKQYSSQVK